MAIETFINCIGFAGAWLLFLGPMHQAALELREEDEARERLRKAHAQSPKIRHASSWWWLLPPVKLLLENRIRRDYRSVVQANLTEEDMAVLVTFMNKARAWMYVGLGGLLIASKETYELIETLHWHLIVLLPLIVIMTVLCLGSVIGAIKIEERGR